MLKKFISKPVLATVVSILLVILGLIGLSKLPLTQFPDIAPPCIVVNAVYPGANAETIIRSVAPSLEEAINGVENISYMSSTASNDGTLSISVYFKLGTNPDQAAVNVQNRVSQASSQMPPEVVQQGITTQKQQNSLIEVVTFASSDEKKFDEVFISNYIAINIIPEIKRIAGVGQAALIGGGKDYSMRIWLDPAKMKTYKLTTDEVTAAIKDKSLEAAPGRLGDRSDEAFEYIIKYKGKLNKPEEYAELPIRGNADGSLLRLKDIARIELGSITYATNGRVDAQPSPGFVIFQLPGSNANEIQIEVSKILEKAKKNFPKEISHVIFSSSKEALDESIAQVKHTLAEAFVLVVLVVLIFLQDFKSTLIPAIAVPVAIIGTFFFMYVFGFSINLLTLFALILAIGIVVDDAIVVVEAVHAKMEHKHLPAKEATIEAMQEITGAIISITLVMTAVFLPVGFMEGSTGLFYRQFAFTMAIAIVISGINALTLSPALAALFLKNQHIDHDPNHAPQNFKQRFFLGFNAGFNNLTERYTSLIRFLLNRKWVALTGLAVIVLISGFLIYRTPTGFVPAEDNNLIVVAGSTPSGTSLSRTSEVLKQAESILMKYKAAKYTASVPGYNIITSSNSPSAATMFYELKKYDERGELKNINEILGKINTDLAEHVKGGSFFAFSKPTVPGFSNIEALDVQLQDRGSRPIAEFADIANKFIGDLNKQPAIAAAFTTFKADFPQYQLDVDNDKAVQLGVNVKDVLQTVQSFFGTSQPSDFNRFGKYYKVVLQADAQDKRDLSSFNNIYVKNKRGEMVPVSTVVKLTRVFGSETASRYNLFNSIQLNVVPKTGHSTGEAIQNVRELAAQQLPQDVTYEFSGQAKEEIASGGQSTIIFILCLVFVYFLLAAQYESYILPLSVILSIPTGVLGVFTAISFKGINNNIYVQVALIMLIGLLAKNAILIVEFALQRRRAGKSLVASAIEAARLRLRPILMTSLAFVFGLFPMSIATGPSAQGNHSISFAAAGGMIFGVVFGLMIVPVLFVIFQSIHERFSSKKIINLSENQILIANHEV